MLALFVDFTLRYLCNNFRHAHKIVDKGLAHTAVIQGCRRVIERYDNDFMIAKLNALRLAVDFTNILAGQKIFHAVTAKGYHNFRLDNLELL